MSSEVDLIWATPPPKAYSAPDYELDEFEPQESVDAWRWFDLLEDPMIKLDMTARGFNWTPEELSEATALARAARGLGVPLTDKTLPEIEATLASGRHDNTQGE